MKSKKFVSDRLVKLFSYSFITFVSLACLYPLLMVLGVSFSDNTAVVQHGYKVIPEVFSLEMNLEGVLCGSVNNGEIEGGDADEI